MVSYADFFQNDLRREVEQIRREQIRGYARGYSVVGLSIPRVVIL